MKNRDQDVFTYQYLPGSVVLYSGWVGESQRQSGGQGWRQLCRHFQHFWGHRFKPAVVPQCVRSPEAEPNSVRKAEGPGGGEGQRADTCYISTVIKQLFTVLLIYILTLLLVEQQKTFEVNDTHSEPHFVFLHYCSLLKPLFTNTITILR